MIFPDSPASDDSSPLIIGQKVEIRHRPSHAGDTIVIPATVVASDPPYLVDTEYQKSILVQRKHLTPV